MPETDSGRVLKRAALSQILNFEFNTQGNFGY